MTDEPPRCCRDKIKHKSAKAARTAIEHMAENRGAGLKSLDVYKRPNCNKWHVGHKYRLSSLFSTFDSLKQEGI